MKILQISPYLDPKGGGQERHVLALAKTLSSLGHKVTILTCGSYPQSVAQGFNIIKIRSVNLLGLCIISMKDLIRLLTRDRFDVCHLHYQTLLGEIVLLGNKIRGLPTITTLHTIMLRRTPAKFFYDRISLRFISALSSKVICLSPSIMNDLVRRGLKRSKCVVIPNALDVKPLKDEFHKIAEELKGPKFDILFVGKLEKRKGIHWLLKSLLLLHKEGKKYTLKIAGHGPMRKKLDKMVSENNLDGYVELLGYVPQKELLKCFLLSKVVVVPSSFEGVPTIALEAMAAGKPLIVSNIPGLNELIVNEGNGIIVTPMNIQELASAIDKVLRSQKHFNSLTEINEKILAKLDWNVVANDIVRTYFQTNEQIDLYSKVSLQSEAIKPVKKHETRIHLENVAMFRKKVEMRSWGSNGADTASGSRTETPPHTYDVELLRKSVQGVDLQKKSILNVAGGRGREAEVLIQTGCGELVLGDIAKVQLLGAKNRKEKKRYDNLELILLDAEHLPFRFKTFDFGYICMGLHHVPDPYRAISELCNVSRGKVIFVDILNPLITKILGFFGLFKIEGSGMEPIRLEKRKVESTLNQRRMRVNISYFFVPPPFGGGNVSYETFKSLASVLNCLMMLTKQKLGPLFGNVAVIRGEK